VILSTMAALLVGCKDAHTGELKEDTFRPDPSISLRQMSLFPGSTNSGVTPSMVLSSPAGDPVNPALLAEQLEKKTLFVSADGDVVGAAPIIPQKGDSMDTLFAIMPAAPLRVERWYDVVYSSNSVVLANGNEVKWKLLSDHTYYLGEGVMTRFFTSSAPQLRAIDVMGELDAGNGTASSLSVFLSEPLALEDLISGGYLVSASTQINGRCLIGGRECGEAVARPDVQDSGVVPILVLDSGEVPPPPRVIESTSWFLYQIDVQVPIQFEFALALSLRGSTRTVQEAFNAGAIRGTTTVADGFLHYPMDISTWRQRSTGSEFGWSNVE